MFFPFVITGNLIGKATEKEWRENDGLVSVISSQHPFNQAYTNATDKIQKGIWQIKRLQNMIGIMLILSDKIVLIQCAQEKNYKIFGII